MTSTPSTRFDHRDHAVVPWISLSSSSSAATSPTANLSGASLASSHSTAHIGSVTSGSEHHQQRQCSIRTSNRQSCKILSLLATRERIGICSSSSSAAGVAVSRVGWLQEGRHVSTKSLAMSGAWYVHHQFVLFNICMCVCSRNQNQWAVVLQMDYCVCSAIHIIIIALLLQIGNVLNTCFHPSLSLYSTGTNVECKI